MTVVNSLERFTFRFSVWVATSSTCWPGPGCSGKERIGSGFSFEHEALMNGELLSSEKVLSPNGGHTKRSLEGDGSEVCTEDQDYLEHAGGRITDVDVLKLLEKILAVWNSQVEDCWREVWSCYRRWGGVKLVSSVAVAVSIFTSCRAFLFLHLA